MTTKRKLSIEEKLATLVAQAEADEAMKHVESLSGAELEKELADAGVDMDAEREKLRALLEKHGVLPEEGEKPEAAAEPAKVVSLAARRRSGPPWTVILAAAVAILAIGYALKTTGPRPEDDLANRHHAPEAPPSNAPPEPTPDTPPEDLVAHPPPKPCKPLPPGVVRIEGTISRDGERFVLVPDRPVCGANEESIEELELVPATSQVDLARFGVARVRVEGRVAPRDAAGALVLRVDRAVR